MKQPLLRKGVSVILVNTNKELLIIRLPDKKGGGWKFPSGGIDKDETPEEAVLREANEELGAKKVKILANSSHTHKYLWPKDALKSIEEKYGIPYEGQEWTSFLVEYVGEDSELTIDNREAAEYLWVKPVELDNYFTFDGQLEYAKKVLKEFNTLLET